MVLVRPLVLFVCICFLGLSVGAQAACPVSRPGELPLDQVPSGADASREQMRQALAVLDQYVQQAERYLDCRYLNPRQHNRMVSALELLGDRYNEQLRLFQQRQPAVAESQ